MSHSTPGIGIQGSAVFNSAVKLDSSVGTMERGSINRPVNPIPMPEQEAYRPQAEPAAEQPQNRPTPEAGAIQPRPENEVAANPRILALMQERDAAERRLQEAILDIETREQSPAFQKAKELFRDGGNIEYADGYTDPDYVVLNYKISSKDLVKQVTVFGIQTQYNNDRNKFSSAYVHEPQDESLSDDKEDHVTNNLLQDYSIDNRSDKWQIISYLIDLSTEAS